MSGVDRSMPEVLPVRTAARVLLTALFFSHVFPIALVALLRACGVETRTHLSLLVVGELACPLLAALGVIHGLFRAGKCRYGFAFFSRQDWGMVMGSGILVCAGSMGIGTLWKALLQKFAIPFADSQVLLKVAGNAPISVFLGLFVLIVIVTPLLEEIVFRRTLYSFLLPLGKWQSCVFSAVVFSALHFYLAGIPSLIFFGIVLQIVFLKTKNLAVPVAVHAFFNAVAMLGVRFLQG